MRFTAGMVFLSMIAGTEKIHPAGPPPKPVPLWEFRPPLEGAKPLLSERQIRGVYIASNQETSKLGNFPSELRGQNWGAKETVSLVVFPQERVAHRQDIGIVVRLVNRRNADVYFDTCDWQLRMAQEAIDKDGKWRAIESCPDSWCGNSFGTAFLKPGQYWQFPALVYDGPFKTKLRIRLEMGKSGTIYSNEFDGAIHPGQLSTQTSGK